MGLAAGEGGAARSVAPRRDTTFAPDMEAQRREALLKGWHKAMGRSLHWAEE